MEIEYRKLTENDLDIFIEMRIHQLPPYFGCPSGKMGLLSSMFTNPDYRRMGIARELLHRVVEEARNYGCGYVFVHNNNFIQYKL